MIEIIDEKFKVADDKTADWALRQIKADNDEFERLDKLAADQIAELNEKRKELKEKYGKKTSYLRSLLCEYFMSVPHKSTKTQETYKLLSGSLVMKKASQKIIHDDEKLLAYLDQFEDSENYIKVERSIKWSEFKKELEIMDGKVVDKETGEIVDGCAVEEIPVSFDIKF